ncbi:MAG: hypothetical protein ABJB11_00185 [Ferruginibacter sp.]
MKKTLYVSSVLLCAFALSCTDQAKAPGEKTKEVIIVQPAPQVITKEAPKKTTTITLDKNGVSATTKNVDIKVKTDNKPDK